MKPMRRRRFLAAVGTLLPTVSAGCTSPLGGTTGEALAPTAQLRMTAVSDTEIARRAAYSFETTDTERYHLLRSIVTNGPVTTDAQSPPLREDHPIVYEDAVYWLSHEVIARQPRGFAVTINPIRNGETPSKAKPTLPESQTIQYEELPAVDRGNFATLGFTDERPFGIGTTFSYLPAGVKRSVLVPTPEYPIIVWPNGPARFSVDESYPFTRKTYRYTAEKIASTAKYGQRVRDRYAFTLAGIPAEEQRILRTAIASDHGYIVDPDAEPSSALRSLVARFRSANSVGEESEADDNGPYLVRYDGQVYWTVLRLHSEVFKKKNCHVIARIETEFYPLSGPVSNQVSTDRVEVSGFVSFGSGG
jgi:hypothetical protein